MTETSNEIEYPEIINIVSKDVIGVEWKPLFKHILPKSPLADISDMPVFWMYFLFISFYGGIVTILGYFLFLQYSLNRTQTFISLQRDAGVCIDQPLLESCCEVPLTITGDYLADIHGYWSTEPQFSYVNAAYGVTLAGVTYSNEQWTKIMTNVIQQVESIGEKGSKRDFAWNIVAWDSYTAEDSSQGYFRFYSTGDAGITYNKYIYDIVYGAKDENCGYFYDWTASYNALTATLDITINLNISLPFYTCPYNIYETSTCFNLCPETFPFKQFGYDPSTSNRPVQPELSLSLDMNAISTSMAINYNMMTLDHLVNVVNDHGRISLFNEMNSSKYITEDYINSTSSYYDTVNAPTDPIYCTKFNDPHITVPACFVRIGNTLAYAVTTSWGYYPDQSAQYPKQCKYSTNTTAEKYYCGVFDVIVALIYYPNPCDGKSSTTAGYSFRRKLQETYEQDPYFDIEDMINRFEMTDSTDTPTEFPSSFPTASPIDNSIENPYYSASPIDNSTEYAYYSYSTFEPYNKPCVDNGLIIQFAKAAAKAISLDKANGDTKVPDATYDALISLFYYNYSNPSAFNAICPGANDTNGMFIPAGCAVIAIEFYGDSQKEISKYYYQPDLYHNQFSDNSTLNKLAINPPTSLIQKYYSCVLNVRDAVIQATGIAFSNATLYVTLGFIVLVYFIKVYLNCVEHKHIKSPLLKEIDYEQKEDEERKILKAQLSEIKKFQKDMIDILAALQSESSSVFKNFTKTLNSKGLLKTDVVIDIDDSHQDNVQSGDIELSNVRPDEIIKLQAEENNNSNTNNNDNDNRNSTIEEEVQLEEMKSDNNL